VEAGSREQNASKEKESSPALMQSEPIGLDTRKPGQTRRGGPKNFAVSRVEQEKWDRQTRKTPAVPCRVIEIAGREVRLRGPA
jgi:hypothetical protein